jgi:hypothetical protein
VGLAALYVAAWTVGSLALKTNPSDLDLYFWPSAENVIGGHPFLIYSAHLRDTYPNANGPLGLVVLLPIAAAANSVGWADNLGARAALTGAMVSILVLLLSYQAFRLVRIAHGGTKRRIAVIGMMLFAPAIWIAVIDYGHVEQPVEVCCTLLAVAFLNRARWTPAGIGLGAAILARTTALFSLIPFALLPLATRRVRPAMLVVLASVVTVAAGLAPFVLADAPAAVHSLLAYRGSLPIGGGSFWIVARHTGFADIGRYADVYLALAAATALAAFILRHLSPMTTITGTLGLLTVTSASFPLFAKTVFPYYLVEPYVFGALWWLARSGSALNWRAVVPLILTCDVFLAKVGTLPLSAGWDVAEGVASSMLVALAVVLVTVDLVRSPTRVATARAPALG